MNQLDLFDNSIPQKGVSQATAKQLSALNKIDESPSNVVIGVDEVGWGAVAGPLVVGVAVVQKGWTHAMIDDSKVLTPAQRERAISEVLIPGVLFYAVLFAPPQDFDAFGAEPTRKALMESASIMARMRFPEAVIVQDGTTPSKVDGSLKGIVTLANADALVPAVSAASIFAKVARDQYMYELSKSITGYGWETNMGYPAPEHRRGLIKHGPTQHHRYSTSTVKKAIEERIRKQRSTTPAAIG